MPDFRTSPPLTETVTLATGYVAPSLAATTIYLYPNPRATLAANLPLELTLTLEIHGVVGTVFGTLDATIPAVNLPAMTFAGRSRPRIADTAWLELLHRPAVPLFRARQRPIMAQWVADLPAPTEAPPLGLAFTGTQLLELPDGDGPRLINRQTMMQPLEAGRGIAQQAMLPTRTVAALLAADSQPIRVGTALREAAMLRTRNTARLREAEGLPLHNGTGFPAAEAVRQRRSLIERAAFMLPVRAGIDARDTETIKTRSRRTIREAQALPVVIFRWIHEQQAALTQLQLRVNWTHADYPQPGRWWPFYEVPWLGQTVWLTTPYTPRPLACRVILSWNYAEQPYCPIIDPPDGVIRVPIQEVYAVLNTFLLARVDNGQAIHTLDFSANLDVDSWGWSWSATVPADQESRVRSATGGQFIELRATLNGTPIRLVVERLARSRQFGSATIKISGRGRGAWLAEPHSPTQSVMNSELRAAQQLLIDALTINNVSIGWTVDWQVNNWGIPAGLWSHTGTYISAATRLAEAAGGYVQADESLQTLHILPYYPVAPWLWHLETPDITLPEDACSVEDIEWQDKPAYNSVWVVGQDQGRRDLVKRTGTAGDKTAPTVVDPLATSTVMTRQRGLRVIADTGRQVHLSLKLPVLAETGIIKPGNLIEYTEQGVSHRGLTRAVNVTWSFPKAWQTIKVETHELEPV